MLYHFFRKNGKIANYSLKSKIEQFEFLNMKNVWFIQKMLSTPTNWFTSQYKWLDNIFTTGPTILGLVTLSLAFKLMDISERAFCEEDLESVFIKAQSLLGFLAINHCDPLFSLYPQSAAAGGFLLGWTLGFGIEKL